MKVRLMPLVVLCLVTITHAGTQIHQAPVDRAKSNQERVLRFPSETPIGKVWIIDNTTKREIKTFHHHINGFDLHWEYFCLAQGEVSIPSGNYIRLDLYPSASRKAATLEALKALNPNDLYELHNADNRTLPYIKHLVGLKALRMAPVISVRNLKHLTSLTSLERLHLHKGCSDAGLAQVARCPWLKGLYFSENRISNRGIQYLSKLSALEELKILGDGLGDKSLQALESLQSLEYLWLVGQCSDEAMIHVAKIPNLKIARLHITLPTARGPIGSMTDKGLYYLSQSQSLERVWVHWMNQITGKGIAYLKNLPNLTMLDVRYAQLRDDDLIHLKAMPHLEYLELPHNESITDAGITHLGYLDKLRNLHIGGWTYSPLSDESLKVVSSLRTIKELNIGGKNVTNHGMRYIGTMTNLNSLGLFFGLNQVTSEGLKELTKLKDLTRLSMSVHNTISDINLLNTLTNLRHLNIRHIHQDHSTLDISGLKNLKELSIKMHYNVIREPGGQRTRVFDKMTDADMACLAGLTNLRQLFIWSPGMSDKGMSYLAGLKELNDIRFHGDPQITDKTLQLLSQLKKLNVVMINDSSITDKGLTYLYEAKALEHLTIHSQNDITPKAIRALKKELPSLRLLNINHQHIDDI